MLLNNYWLTTGLYESHLLPNSLIRQDDWLQNAIQSICCPIIIPRSIGKITGQLAWKETSEQCL